MGEEYEENGTSRKGLPAEPIEDFRKLTRRVAMLKKVRAKWGLLICGSSLAALGIGQCVADVIEDIIVFNVVD